MKTNKNTEIDKLRGEFDKILDKELMDTMTYLKLISFFESSLKKVREQTRRETINDFKNNIHPIKAIMVTDEIGYYRKMDIDALILGLEDSLDKDK